MFRIVFILYFSITLVSSCTYERSERIKISPPPNHRESTSSEKALEALSNAIRSNPSVASNYFRRATLHLNINKLEDALVDIERAEQLRPNNGEYLFLKSQILKEQKKYDQALKTAQRVELIDNSLPELDVHLAELYTFLKDTLSARSHLDLAMKNAPFQVENYFVFGKYRALKGDTTGSIKYLQKAIDNDKYYKKPYLELLSIYDKISRIDSSLKTVREGIRNFPDDLFFYVKKAENFEKITYLDSAKAVYNQVVKLNPERIDIFVKLGNVDLKRKDYNAALKSYEKALEKLNDTSADTYYLAGLCNEKLERFTQAQTYYSKALTINNKLTVADQALNRVTIIINAAIGF